MQGEHIRKKIKEVFIKSYNNDFGCKALLRYEQSLNFVNHSFSDKFNEIRRPNCLELSPRFYRISKFRSILKADLSVFFS